MHFTSASDMLEHSESSFEDHDVFVCGFPCTPFSNQRPGRFGKSSWRVHPDAEVMREVAKVLRSMRPPLAVLENVPGFMVPSRRVILMAGRV